LSQAVMDKAAELGNLITETKEYADVKEKQSAMFKDGNAVELLQAYDELKKTQKEKQEKGEQLTDEDTKAMENAEAQLSGNASINGFFEAQNKFQQLLNSAIETVIKPCREN